MVDGSKSRARKMEQYAHSAHTRTNNPPVGLVTPETDPDGGKRAYAYDPHLDPQLIWAGKTEHTSFDVPTRSLHVHERLDPRTIIEAARRQGGRTWPEQISLFSGDTPPLREAIEFYKHAHGWTNRLIAGDSLLMMNSLLEKEGLGGRVQMVYIDPPYGIRYGSNFQPFINKRDVTDGKDEDLTAEPEMIHAFRDTWELGIHSYLTYLRDRMLLARELLHESGSCFVQIGGENVHLVRNLMDEVFGRQNAMPQIVFRKTTGAGSPSGYVESIPQTFDYLLWYAKNQSQTKIRRLFLPKGVADDYNIRWIEMPDGTRRTMTDREVVFPEHTSLGARPFSPNPMTSQTGGETTTFVVEFEGKQFLPAKGGWKTNQSGMKRLLTAKRIMAMGNTLRFIRYLADFPFRPVIDIWDDTRTSGFGDPKVYVVQTNPKVIQRCVLMTTDPGDLILDPTCGSGTTAYVAEQWGRRWITCDTSRVALTLAKQRLMTAVYDYYQLAHPDEGVDSGFLYKTVPHVTLRSIAQNEPPPAETLYDQPRVDPSKTRVTGPFTVEALPAPVVWPLVELESEPVADASLARSGETLRQAEWRDELRKSGIRGRNGQVTRFSRVEPFAGARWLHADAETVVDMAGGINRQYGGAAQPASGTAPLLTVISFGPEFAPLEQRQVALAIEEAQSLVPRPKLIVFAAFQFDPEAAKDIEETRWPGVTLLKVQMNADLFTADLKKKRASNEAFWLIGQPDLELSRITEGEDQGKYQVRVNGFDYYNTRTGEIDSGDASRIAMWLLDPDYDGRSLFPRQVFFPMAGPKDGWARLGRSLRAEVDENYLEAYRGTVSLPFEPGDYRRAAVKVVDDRGVESLKVQELG